MKRLIVILCAICFCVNAMAQIQTKFWGLELTGSYESLERAKTTIANRCTYAEVKDNVISAMHGSFGGYDWNFIDFSFYKGMYYKTLYFVSFQSYHKTQASAQSKFDSLLNSLNDKYGKSLSEIQKNKSVHMWFDAPYSCMLTLEQGVARNGDI